MSSGTNTETTPNNAASPTSFSWDDLSFWESGEWQVVEEKLKEGGKYNPSKKKLFRALELTPFNETKVMICGQDPYPDGSLATGVAFSVPDESKIPPTLKMIFDEYESDLHYPRPNSGNLEAWAADGVLLWNVVPSCASGHSLSHDWDEWTYLTKEIIEVLRAKGIVFAFIGSRARSYANLLNDAPNCRVIETAHPSPRAHMNKNLKHPFTGSRLFSNINSKLVEIGHDPVNWRLE